jgi:hypothetical protein
MWIQGTAIKITITCYASCNLKISINVLYAAEISPKNSKANTVGGKTHILLASVSSCHVMSCHDTRCYNYINIMFKFLFRIAYHGKRKKARQTVGFIILFSYEFPTVCTYL